MPQRGLLRFASASLRWGLLICLLASGPLLVAQSSATGALGGRVLDTGDNAVVAVAVVVRNQATGNETPALTDASGLFRFTALDPGIYTLEASGAGFAPSRVANLAVEVGRLTEVNTRIYVGGPHEVITVTAEVQHSDLSVSSVATNIDQAALDSLPSNARRWSDFALLTPGVTASENNPGLLNFRGTSSLMNNSTLDGLDNNQAFFSEERGRTRIAYSTSQAAVREFQVNASNYSAEWGRAAGGTINTVTRSGGNQFHGHAFFFGRNKTFAAQNPFTVTTQKTAGGTYVTSPYAVYDSRAQAGVGLGGHLITDKLFWYFVFDEFHRDFPGTARATNPAKLFATPSQQQMQMLGARLGTTTAAATAQYNQVLADLLTELGPVPRTARQRIFFPKFDWQPNDRHHLSVQWNTMRWASPAGVQTSPSASYGLASFGNDAAHEDWYMGRWNMFLTANVVSEARYQYGRDFQSEMAQQPTPFEQPFAANPWGQAPMISLATSYGFTFGKPATLNRAAYPDERRDQFFETLTWVSGRHVSRLGYDYNHISDYTNNLRNQTGTYSYSNVLNFASDLLAPNHCDAGGTSLGNLPCYAWFSQAVGPAIFEVSTADYAFFYTDEWKPSHALTISIGVRYEYESLPDPQKQMVNPDIPQTGALPHDRNNFAPRAGFAWNFLPAHGRFSGMVLRGGYGIYYGRIPNSMAYAAVTETGAANAQRSYFFRTTDEGAPPFPYVFTSAPVNAVAPSAVYFDSHFQNPQIHQAELSVEQRFGHDTVVSASALMSLGRELPNFVDTNIVTSPLGSITYTINDPTGAGPLKGDTYTAAFFTQRINPDYAQITRIFSETNSRYQAVLVKATSSALRGLRFHANYTYSHASDYNQNESTLPDGNDLLDPRNFHQEYGTSNFDVRHRVTGGVVLSSPWRLHSVAGALTNGYSLSSTFQIQSGMPYTMHTSGSVPSIKYVDTVNRIETLSGLGPGINGSGGDNRIPEVGRNTFRKPATFSWDARVTRRVRLTEKVNLELMSEAFNVLNHQNVTSVDTNGYVISGASSPLSGPRLTYESGVNGKALFGSVTNSNSTRLLRERQVQIAVRLNF